MLASITMFLMHPEIPPWEDLGDCPHVTQGQMGGQCIPTLLAQPLPDAEPNNFTHYTATSPYGLPQHHFLKDIKLCQGAWSTG